MVDRATRVVDAQVALVRSRLDPVGEQLELIAALAAAGRIDIESPVDMREALAVMMAAGACGVGGGLRHARPQAPSRRARARRQDRTRYGPARRPAARNGAFPPAPDGRTHTFWGALFWSEALKQPVVNVRTPVRRIDNAFIGGLIATRGGRRSFLSHRRPGRRRRPLFHPGRPRPGAGVAPPDRSAGARPLRGPAAADDQGSRRSGAGQNLGSAGALAADRPGAGLARPCRRRGWAALGVRLSRTEALRARSLAGRAVFPDRGGDRRPRPADQRRDRRRPSRWPLPRCWRWSWGLPWRARSAR